jgi:hypothetical protein
MQAILGEQYLPLVSAAIDASLPPWSELPPGETELRIGIEANCGGMNFAAGVHGRLTVGKSAVHPNVLYERALAILIGHLTPAKRAAVLGKIATAAARCDEADLLHLTAARKLIGQLRKKSGVDFQPTPTYKPRI